jgi:hypothetical protein
MAISSASNLIPTRNFRVICVPAKASLTQPAVHVCPIISQFAELG